jgi:DNA-binding transcriptional LysR family regulator
MAWAARRTFAAVVGPLLLHSLGSFMDPSVTAGVSEVQDLFVLPFIWRDHEYVELRQIVYVEAVARLGGFTRAAEQLHVAQPAVSAQVRLLEAELGTPLFVRTTRRVALTAAGETFLLRARRVLAELDGVRHDLADLADVLRGQVTIGATTVSGGFNVAEALADFSTLHAGIGLRLRAGRVAELLTLLDSAAVDIVIAPVHADLAATCTSSLLTQERLVVALPPGHSLAGRSPLSFDDLRDEQFVCLPPGSGLHAILTAAASEAGYVAHIPFEASTPAAVRELVAAGLGVALLAQSAATVAGPSISIARLEPEPAHPPIGLITRANRSLSPAARACWQHLAKRADWPGEATASSRGD